MYEFKKNLDIKINKTKASKEIGISRPHLSNVLNSKLKCTKILAFCITKYLNKNAEINDFFNRIN